MPKTTTPQIQYTKKIIPDALHGTDFASYKNICNKGFECSIGDDQFLGEGVYFWEGSYLLALRWAQRKTRAQSSREYAIIQASIDLGVCLDLSKPEHLEIIEKAVGQLRKHTSKELNDAVVLNFIDYTIQKLDTVRAIHPKGKHRIFKESRYLARVEPIICIKNTDMIITFELYEKDEF